MKMASVCRICLAGNTRLYAVKNIQLLFQYKQLTNTKFNSKDSRPRALCCFCYQKLLKCHTFSQMALRSEKMFSLIYDKGLEVTHDHITEVNLDMKQHMYVTAMQFNITITGNVTNADLQDQVTVKDEPLPGIDVKEEVTAESDELLEVGSSLEDCTRSELIFNEDSNDQHNDVKDVIFGIHDEQTRIDNSKTSFGCNNCHKIFYIKSKLISHIRNSHSQVKKHTEITKTIQNLKNQFTCHVCDRSFVSKVVLTRHIRHIHTRKKPFTCNECDKQFNLKCKLVIHMRTHTGEKPFACNICDKQFIVKHNLVPHMRTHTGEMPFACHVCDKRLRHKSSLELHIRTHTGEKLFICHICGKQFSLKHGLVQHMRIHSGVKPFTCNECGKQFSRKDYLVLHMRTHTGEKPFACKVCDKQFNQKCTLVLHMRTHTR